ncbi:hypothetical protein [Salmonella enterica]|uniref:hypothetical protein n=1 Tax=Salmonella enterica TaxID=28901 RepID=UPI00077A072C|nr:hypothetical protein [Salmonella enterica]KYB61123.1 hypothetical protein AGQ48_24485 [Salmonella enterica subsp. enterica]
MDNRGVGQNGTEGVAGTEEKDAHDLLFYVVLSGGKTASEQEEAERKPAHCSGWAEQHSPVGEPIKSGIGGMMERYRW